MELEHLTIETKLIVEMFVSVMGEYRQGWFYLQQNKKKAKAESKNCHAKTMLSLKKPIKLI